MNSKKIGKAGVALIALAVLAGCSDSDSDGPSTRSYDVTVTNLTSDQPLSPVALVLHQEDYSPWSIGSPASDGLEQLAEGGDNSVFLAEAAAVAFTSNGAGTGAIGPGSVELIEVTGRSSDPLLLTLATMLVNTNDAFAGSSGLDLTELRLGDELTVRLPVYDAGTEVNDELAGTIPGPADGGEGFNSERVDVNVVARHPGVVTDIDGYADSVLEQSHRFDGPVAQVVIRRTR